VKVDVLIRSLLSRLQINGHFSLISCPRTTIKRQLLYCLDEFVRSTNNKVLYDYDCGIAVPVPVPVPYFLLTVTLERTTTALKIRIAFYLLTYHIVILPPPPLCLYIRTNCSSSRPVLPALLCRCLASLSSPQARKQSHSTHHV